MSDVTEALAGAYEAPPVGSDERETFSLENDRMATWAVRKLRSFEDEHARLVAAATEQAEQIDAWLADATHGLDSQMAFFEHLLVEYHQALGEDGPKTYKLPGAQLKRRPLPDKLEIDDSQAVAEWVEATAKNGELFGYRVELCKVTISKAKVKAAIKAGTLTAAESGAVVFTDEGEVVPGLRYERQGDRNTVKLEA